MADAAPVRRRQGIMPVLVALVWVGVVEGWAAVGWPRAPAAVGGPPAVRAAAPSWSFLRVDGAPVAMDDAPVMVNGTLLVPARVLEQAGVTVRWDPVHRQAQLRREERAVGLTAGEVTARADGAKPIRLPQPPELIGGRLFVPVRAVAETLGLEVRWDAGSGMLEIARPGQPGHDHPTARAHAATAPAATSRPQPVPAVPATLPRAQAAPERVTPAGTAHAGRAVERPALSAPPAPPPAQTVPPQTAPPPATAQQPSSSRAVAFLPEGESDGRVMQALLGELPPAGGLRVAGAMMFPPPALPSQAAQTTPAGEGVTVAAAAAREPVEEAPRATPPQTAPAPVASPSAPAPRAARDLFLELPPLAVLRPGDDLPPPAVGAMGPQTPAVLHLAETAPADSPATVVASATPAPQPARPAQGATSPPQAGQPGDEPADQPGEQPGTQATPPQEAASGPSMARPTATASRVLGVSVRRRDGRPEVAIVSDGPVVAQPSAVLSDPPRIVIDLKGAVIATETTEYRVDGPVLQGVRLGQFQPDVVRVALDLAVPVGFDLAAPGTDGSPAAGAASSSASSGIARAAAAGEGRGAYTTSVLLNHPVLAVNWIPPGQESGPVRGAPTVGRRPGQLWVQVAGTPEVRFASLQEPRRLVADIQHATLVTDPGEWAVSQGAIRRIRVSQFQPDVVRVVMETDKPVSPQLIASRELALRQLEGESPWPKGQEQEVLPVVLDDYQRITEMTLRPLGAGGASILLRATGPGQVRSFYLRNPDRLVVDLPGMVVDLPDAGSGEGFGRVVGSAGPIKSLRVGQYLPRSARLVMELRETVGHRVFRFDGGQTMVVTLGAEPLAGRKVAIDAGHGGEDPGARGPSGTTEKDFNLDIARRLEELVRSVGMEAVMTRGRDVFVPLDERVAIARRADADVFVSIHNNASTSGVGLGTEVFYAPNVPQSRLLAQLLYDELTRQLNTDGRGVKMRRDLRVLRLAPMPASLVEVAFVDHPEDEARLMDPEFRQRAAEAVFSGLVSYFSFQTGEISRGTAVTAAPARGKPD